MKKLELQEVINTGMAKARDIKNGGISTLLDIRPINLRQIDDRGDVYSELGRSLSGAGLVGTAMLFDVKRGSPPAMHTNLEENPYRIGFYIPRAEDGKSPQSVQTKLDSGVARYRIENGRRLPGNDGLVLVTNAIAKQWKEEGIVTKVDRKEGFQGNLEHSNRIDADNIGDAWLHDKYLPALVKASLTLPREGLSVVDLAREGPVVRRTGSFVSINFGALINTTHTESQRQWDFARDKEECRFGGTEGVYEPGSLFSVEDLIILEQMSLSYRPADPWFTLHNTLVSWSGSQNYGR